MRIEITVLIQISQQLRVLAGKVMRMVNCFIGVILTLKETKATWPDAAERKIEWKIIFHDAWSLKYIGIMDGTTFLLKFKSTLNSAGNYRKNW